MYEYNLLLSHNCGYLYSEERTTGGFLRMATNKPPCVIKSTSNVMLCGLHIAIFVFVISFLMNEFSMAFLEHRSCVDC